MRPIPLLNIGNTCYINSVLQCILYQKEFQESLMNCTNDSVVCNSLRYLITLINNNDQIEFRDFIKELQTFVDYFISKNKLFVKFEQSDSHEFLVCFIDLLIQETKRNDLIQNEINDSWTNFYKNNNSIFTKLFHGQLKTTINCESCKKSKAVFEEFNSINLNIDLEGNLHTLFENYLTTEKDDDPDNLYFCDHCKCNTITTKKIRLNILPGMLFIIFKRYTPESKKTVIEFPDTLKIKESHTEKIIDYSLTGIINHLGNNFNGHYMSNVLVGETWYIIDDDMISNKKLKNKSMNYILIYSR
uniref:USP domain-containing protein n=1 Tax=viral metagenome TaxID=1070528 RepID=A0A6C0I9S9_9ZZZZ